MAVIPVTTGPAPRVLEMRVDQCQRWILHWRKMMRMADNPGAYERAEINVNSWLDAWSRDHARGCTNCACLTGRTA